MTNHKETPYAALKRVFHEPSRMAIVTALCAAEDGLTFGDLKARCGLTDGNLNRHLKALTDTQAVRLEKTTRSARACTIVYVTDTGREHFVAYLRTLEEVLRHTAETLATEEKVARAATVWQIPEMAR